MDSATVTIIVVVIFALIAIFSFVVYQQRGEAEIKLFGMSLKIKGSNEKPQARPAISAKDITSREGGLLAEDGIGQGIEVEKVDVKDDVLLSSVSLSNKEYDFNNPARLGGVKAEGLNAGGNITIQQFIGNQLPIEQQIEFFIRQIGLEESHKKNYLNSQFEAYSNVWKSLQALRLTGNDLWKSANRENLVAFAEQLKKTSMLVRESGIFFDDEDYDKLLKILHEFGKFEGGKIRLIDMRSRFAPETERANLNYERALRYLIRKYASAEVQSQIEENKMYKLEYESLLERVRVSFRIRLSK